MILEAMTQNASRGFLSYLSPADMPSFSEFGQWVRTMGNVNFPSTHQTKFNFENAVTPLHLELPAC
jgi:hypothetical protein